MKAKQTIRILHLYPKDMNIYGDHGNVLALKRRLQWHGFNPEIVEYNQGDKFPDNIDLVIGGGGQDSGQTKIQQDIISIGPRLKDLAEAGTPMLVICGLYQLFGKYFKTTQDEIIKGIGLLDIETIAGQKRLIGNIIIKSKLFGTIVGYENHSGQTFLSSSVKPLGQVKKGAGNNSKDKTEGAIYKNVIGSYLHGSLLPKNPTVSDFLIEKAVVNRYGKFNGKSIDDSLAEKAKKIASKRPR